MTDDLKNKITDIIREKRDDIPSIPSYKIAEMIAKVVDNAVAAAVSEGTNIKEILDAFDLEIKSK